MRRLRSDGMLHVVWFNWDKAKSSNKFCIEGASKQDYSAASIIESSDSDSSDSSIDYCEPYGVQRPSTTARVVDGSGFKTVIGNPKLPKGGRYFFQVQIVKGILIKIGVSVAGINPDKAFCDTDEGWAFYNGETRHASNQLGQKYGEPLKEGDVVGVMLDSEQVSPR